MVLRFFKKVSGSEVINIEISNLRRRGKIVRELERVMDGRLTVLMATGLGMYALGIFVAELLVPPSSAVLRFAVFLPFLMLGLCLQWVVIRKNLGCLWHDLVAFKRMIVSLTRGIKVFGVFGGTGKKGENE